MNIKKWLISLSLLSICATSAWADDNLNPWLIRLRAIDVMPDPSSSTITLIGGHVTEVGDNITPELDFSYFFNQNISAELILATSRHHPRATQTALGKVNLGSVNTLPPTLTAQYHFFPQELISPYIGAGVNFTHFFNVNKGPVATSIHYGNTVGPAGQIGADVHINESWSVNFDLKKIYMRPDVRVNTALGALKTHVKLDPLVWGIGVGYKF